MHRNVLEEYAGGAAAAVHSIRAAEQRGHVIETAIVCCDREADGELAAASAASVSAANDGGLTARDEDLAASQVRRARGERVCCSGDIHLHLRSPPHHFKTVVRRDGRRRGRDRVVVRDE